MWTQDHWKTVEEDLGTAIPEDYKEFIEIFGFGKVNEFLTILVPNVSNKYVDLVKRGRMELAAYESARTEFPEYYQDNTYPTPGGLLPFGLTDNGEVLYWRTVGAPTDWTVTVYESRGPEKCDFPGGMCDFLVAILTRRLECNALPRSFARHTPTFRQQILLAVRNEDVAS
jgi:hypothetical protein